MALTPTEREELFFKAMVDAANGSTPEELEPTERKEHWYKEIIDAIKSGGGGSGGGVLVVTESNRKLSESFNTIEAALKSGQMVQLVASVEVLGIIYAANRVYDGGAILYDVTGMGINGRAVWESANPKTASLTRL